MNKSRRITAAALAAVAMLALGSTAPASAAVINQNTVSGPRYNAANQADVGTEEFAA